MINTTGRRLTVLIALCILLYFLGLGAPSLTDPDDTFYGETAKEMLAQGSILTPLIFQEPNFEKPPLYFWLVMLSYKLFGVDAVAARFASALFGLLSVVGVFLFVRKVLSEETAFITAAILASAVWWIGLTHVVLTDMVFSTLIAFSLYCFYLWFKSQRLRYLLWFAVLTALATLAKTPLGLVLPLVTGTVFLIVSGNRKLVGKFLFSGWWFLWLILVLPWFLYASFQYGYSFLWEYFVNCHWNRLLHAEHHQFNTQWFYPGVIIVGMIPWTSYFPLIGAGFRKMRNEYLFAVTWFVVMYIIFNVAQSKLSTYISPVFPALAMMIGFSATGAELKKYRSYIVSALLVVAGIGLGIAPLFLRKDYPQFVTAGFLSFGPIALTSLAAAVFMFRQRLQSAVIAGVIGMIGFAIITPYVLFPKLETALTDSDLPALVKQYHYSGQPILCNSLYVRGVYYYSGNPVAVMAGSKTPFWSMQPVTILSEDQEVRDFAAAHDTLLCVFSRGELGRLNKLTGSDRDNTIISSNIDRIVALSIRRAPSP